MLIPFVGCFSILMVTDFPVYIVRLCLFVYSFWARIVHSEIKWSVVLVLVLQNLHLGSAPLWRILAWKFLVKRLWSCAATINPSVSALSPALLSHWWVSCKSTSAFWLRRGYWPCKGFDFQAVSIAFFPFSLAILFNFWAFSVFFISPSNSVSRSKSISHANSLASFTTEREPFSFSCFKASSRIQLSHKFKYQKRPFADVL